MTQVRSASETRAQDSPDLFKTPAMAINEAVLLYWSVLQQNANTQAKLEAAANIQVL